MIIIITKTTLSEFPTPVHVPFTFLDPVPVPVPLLPIPENPKANFNRNSLAIFSAF